VAGEFLHGRCSDEPGADFEAGGGGFEEIGGGFSAGDRSPAVAEYFSVDRRAHVADDVGAGHFGFPSIDRDDGVAEDFAELSDPPMWSMRTSLAFMGWLIVAG
jgi:hypothetical protein